jgi:hypothetical protein
MQDYVRPVGKIGRGVAYVEKNRDTPADYYLF